MNLPPERKQRGQRFDLPRIFEVHPADAFAEEAIYPRDCAAHEFVSEHRDVGPLAELFRRNLSKRTCPRDNAIQNKPMVRRSPWKDPALKAAGRTKW